MKDTDKSRPIALIIRRHLARFGTLSGKVFYSSPESLFIGSYILMGYNPGGDPDQPEFKRSTIRLNIDTWSNIKGNDYWDESWSRRPGQPNPLQTRVRQLFDAFGIRPDEIFASNVFFRRSRDASTLTRNEDFNKACSEVWGDFLKVSPARSIICIGVSTAWAFLKQMRATVTDRKLLRTSHPRANAQLITATIEGHQYRIAAVPHLSRFAVSQDLQLVEQIRTHLGSPGPSQR